ncbi:MAG: tRNA uracil 4-sulfurtransferase ThiI [Candidatus Micrarchaeaceae archaeon]
MLNKNRYAIAVYFGELWLKGKNRIDFINLLYSNIRSSLWIFNGISIKNERDHIMLYGFKKSEYRKIKEVLKLIPGIKWFAYVLLADSTIDAILKTSSCLVPKGKAVKLEVHRSYKELPFDSNDLIKTFISQQNKLKFALDKNSKRILHIRVLKDYSMLFINKTKAMGGLPCGSSGKAVILFSGGIDSPVAAFYAMKRGLQPIYLHVHAFKDNDSAVNSKITDIAKKLSYTHNIKIYYAPFYPFQALAYNIPERYELVLFKMFLYQLALRVAEKEGAKAIVTGESLGQVASQTLQNLYASQQGASLPILRPLIGLDKEEIINKAKELNTYNLSIKSYKDVCSFRIKNPATSVNEKIALSLYTNAKIKNAVEKSFSLSKVCTYTL